jgi:hypothetical protein
VKQANSDTAKRLIESLSGNPGLSHELLFYSTFAHRTFGVMQRVGQSGDGFSRLQQSFSEAVEKVRAIVQIAGENGFSGAKQLTELSPQGMVALMAMMRDLSIIKQNQAN